MLKLTGESISVEEPYTGADGVRRIYKSTKRPLFDDAGEELGGDCRRAYDGESGLRELQHYRPDVVLLDIGMSGLDGYETCRRIRQARSDDVMLVAVTGFGQQRDKKEAHRAGFDAHLTKPPSPAQLRKLLARKAGVSASRSATNRSEGAPSRT